MQKQQPQDHMSLTPTFIQPPATLCYIRMSSGSQLGPQSKPRGSGCRKVYAQTYCAAPPVPQDNHNPCPQPQPHTMSSPQAAAVPPSPFPSSWIRGDVQTKSPTHSLFDTKSRLQRRAAVPRHTAFSLQAVFTLRNPNHSNPWK